MLETSQESLYVDSETGFYERLMSVSLFHGVTHDDITEFAAHTPLTFHRYSQGEKIAGVGDSCREVLCLISGRVVATRILRSCAVKISEVLNAGCILSADRLHGRNPHYQHDVQAATEVGIMSFPKKELMKLLQSNEIVLINWLNMLSAAVHRANTALSQNITDSLAAKLWSLIEGFTDPSAREIELHFENEDVFRRSFSPRDTLLNYLSSPGVMELADSGIIKIENRAEALKILSQIMGDS